MGCFEVGDGALTPRLEVGLRHDGGDAETGTGIEVGGGVSYTDPASGSGLTLLVAPSWGASGGGAERLWSAGNARSLAANEDAAPGSGLDAEVGYGFSVLDGRAVATPYAGWSQSSESETLRLGQRLRLGQASEWRVEGELGEDARIWRAGYGYRLGSGLTFTTEASRREPANDDAPEHALMLRASMRW